MRLRSVPLCRSMKAVLILVLTGEAGNRRVDVTEFIAWCKACDIEPKDALQQLLEELP